MALTPGCARRCMLLKTVLRKGFVTKGLAIKVDVSQNTKTFVPGKVQIPDIETQPEPLDGLIIGTDPDSNVFLKSIRTSNSCFQMTSFGATE
ncbi:Uncharacterized protein FWK35_00026702 [Aphis craccivora]|uniref:Uncharacterized protein n=1 Tax=Aphis craccivora TaxID=307492 RepID=A0A6G0X1C1_APHCR|nr:Uncharacterized protein FWK35_00026702 [Aphis craccivora]